MTGNSIQQLQLPPSVIYDSAYGEWKAYDWNNSGTGRDTHDNGVIKGNVLYAFRQGKVLQAATITQRNLDDYSIKNVETSPLVSNGGVGYYQTFLFNGDIILFAGPGTPTGFHKLNPSTQTITTLSTIDISAVSLSTCDMVIQINSTTIIMMFASGSMNTPPSIYSYDFSTGVFKKMSVTIPNLSSYNNVCFSYQKDYNGDLYVGFFKAPKQYQVIKIDADTLGVSLHGVISFDYLPVNYFNAFSSVQIGERLLYISATPSASGKYTGELNLEKLTVSQNEFPSPATLPRIGWHSLYKYHDKVFSATSDKREELNLIQSPPQDNGLVAFIPKGTYVNTLYDTIPISAIPNQSAFEITPHPQKFNENKEIHLGQYQLNDKKMIVLMKK